MSDLLLKLDADTVQYEARVRRLGDAHKETTSHLDRQVDLGDKLTHGLARSLLKAIALKEVVAGIADGFKDASERAEKLSKQSGASAIGLGTSLAGLGFKGAALTAQLESTERLNGPTTIAERQGFAAKLAQLQEGRRKSHLPEISQGTASQAMSAYATGGDVAYGPGGERLGEVLSNYGRYGFSPNMTKEAARIRADRTGPGGVTDERILGEQVSRNRERQSEVAQQDTAAGDGLLERRITEHIAEKQAEHPAVAGLEKVVNVLTVGAAMQYWRQVASHTERAAMQAERKAMRRQSGNDEPNQ